MAINKDSELGNSFVRVVGLLGFICATVAFLLILSGMKEAGPNASGDVVLFTSFIMCAGLAFAGLIVTTLAQISDTLRSIELLIAEQNNKEPTSVVAKKRKKAAKEEQE